MITEKEKKEVIPMLQKVPLFSFLDKKRLDSIANSATKMTYETGKTIAKEGEKGETFFMILDGSVDVRRKKVLAKLGRGQFFGEMALFDNQPRSADVVALEKTTCILLTSWALSGVIGSNPRIAEGIITELVRRLRETNNALTE